jgi:pullulanase
VQASQLSLNGSGIGTFSDRARDAIRGGSAMDGGEALVKNKGYLHLPLEASAKQDDLARMADTVRVGLAGTVRSVSMTDYKGVSKRLEQIDYNGQPAGYASQPSEAVNYVENHDNQTLFDLNAYRLPADTSREERARTQVLALGINALSQGIAYFHAGAEILRSKSMDRNSYDSGDWFNRIDWTLQDNYFATGLPPKGENKDAWPLMKPVLENTLIKPTNKEIAFTSAAFNDFLKIRASSTLFRLRTASDVQQRLKFHNVGSTQNPTLIVGELDGAGYPGAAFGSVVYLINVAPKAATYTIDSATNKAAGATYRLHPAQAGDVAGDQRVRKEAKFDAGTFTVPARSIAVFVR